MAKEVSYKSVDMLKNERVGVIQFIERDVDSHIFLAEGHVLIHLNRNKCSNEELG
jgi:hypothetical protein